MLHLLIKMGHRKSLWENDSELGIRARKSQSCEVPGKRVRYSKFTEAAKSFAPSVQRTVTLEMSIVKEVDMGCDAKHSREDGQQKLRYVKSCTGNFGFYCNWIGISLNNLQGCNVWDFSSHKGQIDFSQWTQNSLPIRVN